MIIDIIKATKQAYKKEIGFIIVYTLIYVGALSAITSLWQMAEIAIEGAVDPSTVDTIIAIILAVLLSSKTYKYIEIKK